jgi:deazaflavin-dependent oxidoreductase (nitroreductase family)
MRPLPSAIERITSRWHAWLYRRTGGRVGGTVGTNRRPVLLLTTTGRRSGLPRTNPVITLRDGDRYVVVASNAGRDAHPAWFLNLRADPQVTVRDGDRVRHLVARVPDAAEAAALWPRLDRLYAGYAAYRARTDRPLPVVVLEPGGQSADPGASAARSVSSADGA